MVAVLFLACTGCGAVGEPKPPLLNIPARSTDLEAAQRGSQLVLFWSLPALTTEGFPVKDLERVVMLGLETGAGSPPGSAFKAGAHQLAVLDHPLEERFKAGERIQYRLALPAAPGKQMALAVENYNWRGRSDGPSNIVVVEIASAPAAPDRLQATPHPGAIRLEWPQASGASSYHVYRSTAEKPAFTLVGSVAEPAFEDRDFRWGSSCAYFVRSYLKTSTGVVESTDSPLVAVVPQDIFPPSPPAGFEAVVTEAAVELSWAPSPEADTAGYYVYRRDPSGPAARLNADPLAAPTFTDKTAQRGRQYTYSVAAVDNKGNESAPSAPQQVSVP
ncbi:MAG: hypothetical protein HY236_02295 [Acidobacteria bacterium]|nr:hypothetical protein [Acidobacteriota bacterium]